MDKWHVRIDERAVEPSRNGGSEAVGVVGHYYSGTPLIMTWHGRIARVKYQRTFLPQVRG